jgi:hypothetical protein
MPPPAIHQPKYGRRAHIHTGTTAAPSLLPSCIRTSPSTSREVDRVHRSTNYTITYNHVPLEVVDLQPYYLGTIVQYMYRECTPSECHDTKFSTRSKFSMMMVAARARTEALQNCASKYCYFYIQTQQMGSNDAPRH